MNFLNSDNVVIGWLRRRIPDIGGWLLTIIGTAFAFYSQLPPEGQAIFVGVLTGNWQGITLGALAGLISVVISQWRSWRATVKPQVVTSDKKKIEVPVLTEEQARAITGYTGPIEDRSKR